VRSHAAREAVAARRASALTAGDTTVDSASKTSLAPVSKHRYVVVVTLISEKAIDAGAKGNESHERPVYIRACTRRESPVAYATRESRRGHVPTGGRSSAVV
jgi:hypothetical protein